MRRRRRMTLVVMLVAVLLVACGGDDADEEADAATDQTEETDDEADDADSESEGTEEADDEADDEDGGPAEIRYEVQSGDTLSRIADDFGVTVSDLVDVNDLDDPDVLFEGQELVIPTP